MSPFQHEKHRKVAHSLESIQMDFRSGCCELIAVSPTIVLRGDFGREPFMFQSLSWKLRQDESREAWRSETD
jgi:hypothetical protein